MKRLILALAATAILAACSSTPPAEQEGAAVEDRSGAAASSQQQRRKVMHVSDKSHPVRSDLDFFSLAANKAGRHMEPFLIDIYPSSAQDVKMSAHEGAEFLYVFSGELEIRYGTETYRLAEGDSIYYDSIVAHHVHCGGERPAQFLAVVYAPA